MKMNDTVARIVEIMFQDVDMNEETSAIRDEVMNNCQERYNDLVASGLSEDDAISAVVESLSGMDDVLRPYKRRKRHTVYEDRKVRVEVGNADEGDDEDEDEDFDGFADEEDLDDLDDDEDEDEDPERFVTIPAATVRKIDLQLTAEDVIVEPSADGDYHVLWNDEDSPHISVSVNDGVLCVWHDEDESEAKELAREMEQSARDEAKRLKMDVGDFVRSSNGRLEVDFSKLSGMLKSLNGTLKVAFRKGVNFGEGEVTIQVPENALPSVQLTTTSGEIRMEAVTVADLSICTTSGDVAIKQREDQHMKAANIVTTSGTVDDVTLYADEVNIRTTSGDVSDVNIHASGVNLGTVSGDVEADIHADNVGARTTSGDMTINGCMQTLNASTVSGDLEVEANVEALTFKTVSGDADLSCGEKIRSVTGNTVSGDVDVELPDNLGEVAIVATSRMGEVHVNHPTEEEGPAVSGRISSNTGDITIE